MNEIRVEHHPDQERLNKLGVFPVAHLEQGSLGVSVELRRPGDLLLSGRRRGGDA